MKTDRRWWNDGRLEAELSLERQGLWLARGPDPIEAPNFRTPCEPIAEELLVLARAHFFWHIFSRLRLTRKGIEVIVEDASRYPVTGLRVEVIGSDEEIRGVCRAALLALIERPWMGPA